MAKSETILSTLGPMSPWLDGINLFMKVVLDSEPWKSDASLYPLPWRDTSAYFIRSGGRPQLNIGVMWDDQIVKPVAPVNRALREVVDKLKTLDGFKVTEWSPYQHERGMKILVWSIKPPISLAACPGILLTEYPYTGETLLPRRRSIPRESPLEDRRARAPTYQMAYARRPRCRKPIP